MCTDVHEVLGPYQGVSLAQLDERAALLRRVDNKYTVHRDQWLELVDSLKDDHDVLDIDGRRVFAYRTTYFETPDLRCFKDHVEGRSPRFKARTRFYRDSGMCVFEVKLKRGDSETDKRQIDYGADDSERLTSEARQCLDQALTNAGIETPPDLSPSLHTSFRRITFAARGGPQRLTCDLGVRLSSPQGQSVTLREDLVLVETKTEDGDSPADRALVERGLEPISLSKYRVGMSLVGGAATDEPQPGTELFG